MVPWKRSLGDDIAIQVDTVRLEKTQCELSAGIVELAAVGDVIRSERM